VNNEEDELMTTGSQFLLTTVLYSKKHAEEMADVAAYDRLPCIHLPSYGKGIYGPYAYAFWQVDDVNLLFVMITILSLEILGITGLDTLKQW